MGREQLEWIVAAQRVVERPAVGRARAEGTPAAIVDRLNQEINAIAASPDLAPVLEPDGTLSAEAHCALQEQITAYAEGYAFRPKAPNTIRPSAIELAAREIAEGVVAWHV